MTQCIFCLKMVTPQANQSFFGGLNDKHREIWRNNNPALCSLCGFVGFWDDFEVRNNEPLVPVRREGSLEII